MVFIGFSTLALIFLTATAFLNYLTAIRLEAATPLQIFPKVSLLIPVRNEASNLQGLLKALFRLDYPHLEIIFLDDESQDDTLRFLQGNESKKIKVFQGKPLPKGWVGKPWACHQLAEYATGEILIFCDADMRPDRHAISQTVSTMEKFKVDVLTALPSQEMVTFLEKAIIPFVMHLPIFSLVPLQFSFRFKNPSWVVANGQWLAFTKRSYEAVRGHESVKNSLLEDMELSKNLVRNGFRVLPVIAAQEIRVRMYRSGRELAEGFTKNLYLLCGKRSSSLWVLFFFWASIYIGPFIFLIKGDASSSALFLLLILRAITAKGFKASWKTILLHPVGAVGFLVLMMRSWYFWVFKKQVSWRGRAYGKDLVQEIP